MGHDHPLTGVGPNMVPRVYDQYRPEYAVNQTNPHLHNVPLQIAAERGLPALAIWAAFISVLTIGIFRDYWEADTFKKYMREMGVKDAIIVDADAHVVECDFAHQDFVREFSRQRRASVCITTGGPPKMPSSYHTWLTSKHT